MDVQSWNYYYVFLSFYCRFESAPMVLPWHIKLHILVKSMSQCCAFALIEICSKGPMR